MPSQPGALQRGETPVWLCPHVRAAPARAPFSHHLSDPHALRRRRRLSRPFPVLRSRGCERLRHWPEGIHEGEQQR